MGLALMPSLDKVAFVAAKSQLRSRTKTSCAPFVSPLTRFMATLSNAM
jgi:hypothetical protein